MTKLLQQNKPNTSAVLICKNLYSKAKDKKKGPNRVKINIPIVSFLGLFGKNYSNTLLKENITYSVDSY